MEIPNEVWEIVEPRAWAGMSRLQKLEAVNLAIVGLFMDERSESGHRDKVYKLEQLREQLIIKNWKKPKYED